MVAMATEKEDQTIPGTAQVAEPKTSYVAARASAATVNANHTAIRKER